MKMNLVLFKTKAVLNIIFSRHIKAMNDGNLEKVNISEKTYIYRGEKYYYRLNRPEEIRGYRFDKVFEDYLGGNQGTILAGHLYKEEIEEDNHWREF